MKSIALLLCLFALLLCGLSGAAAETPISAETEECLSCHATLHPGIVEDWQRSRHARSTPLKAREAKGLALKVSTADIPQNLQRVSVGCAECHTLNAESHADTFEHAEQRVHVVVSPRDCAVCHAVEAKQYTRNIMSHARKNLTDNPVFQDLERTVIGSPVYREGKLTFTPPDESTRAEACFYCHGTRLSVVGTEVRETDAGEMEFPRIEGWPNQGVGRVNLDGSLGACSACHTRHAFSIEMARKPYTCKECHVGPDVPAFKVYESSKHGNLFSTFNGTWNFRPVPWTVGADFTAPTCAACHISLLVNTDGAMVAQRTHEMGNRLSQRIFGLIYAHPYPQNPDTTLIRNRDGLPLPTDLTGGYASEYLIGETTQKERRKAMQAICLTCHDTSWVQGHWQRYDNSVRQTNAATQTATLLMGEIWQRGGALGLAAGGSLFDEALEKKWCDIWLFYSNTVRFAAAMAGGGDFGVFADGRYQLAQRIAELDHWLRMHPPAKDPPASTPGPGPAESPEP
ncbi:MAG: hydroxylamine oxidase [Desulfobacterales bacterium]|nr:hydroxylamine oxidase [Desulfobacterales bacterium]